MKNMSESALIRRAEQVWRENQIYSYKGFLNVFRNATRYKADSKDVENVARYIYGEKTKKETNKYLLDECVDGIRSPFQAYWNISEINHVANKHIQEIQKEEI